MAAVQQENEPTDQQFSQYMYYQELLNPHGVQQESISSWK
jgi:hypothetical protein